MKNYSKTQSTYHPYKLMELQYGIKQLAECPETAEAAEKLTYKPTLIMSHNVAKQVSRTYLQAGVCNIHAPVSYDLDRKPEAKTYFEKALALDTSFALARQNPEALKSMRTGNTKNNPGLNNSQPGAPPANKPN